MPFYLDVTAASDPVPVQFEIFDPKPYGLPPRPPTITTAKQKYLNKEFCEARVQHIKEYFQQILECA